jgi:L-amino acid N-acyltransferase YncA
VGHCTNSRLSTIHVRIKLHLPGSPLSIWSRRIELVNPTIDKLLPSDWEQVRSIYLEGIATGNATFETDAPDWETWNSNHLRVGRLAAREGDAVIGWAALSAVSRRRVYSGVAEVSVYIAASARGRGIGRLLLVSLVREAEENVCGHFKQEYSLRTRRASIYTRRADFAKSAGARESAN